jgi:hypothetical protein
MLPDDQLSEVKEMISRILEYLIENPEAKDTLDGIERWWVGSTSHAPNHSSVERAVGALVSGGWMKVCADAPFIYEASELGLSAGTVWLNQNEAERDWN